MNNETNVEKTFSIFFKGEWIGNLYWITDIKHDKDSGCYHVYHKNVNIVGLCPEVTVIEERTKVSHKPLYL